MGVIKGGTRSLDYSSYSKKLGSQALEVLEFTCCWVRLDWPATSGGRGGMLLAVEEFWKEGAEGF